MRFLSVFCFSLCLSFQAFGANIVCSITPLFAIAKELLKDIDEPHLLIESQVSPHVFVVKPTNAKLIETADLVIWIGDQLETGLQKFIHKKDPQKVMTLMSVKGLSLLPLQSPHSHDETEECDHHQHHQNEKDPHIWLSFSNLALLIDRMSERFALLYMDKKELIHDRAERLKKDLSALYETGKKVLKERQVVPIAAYHNGYQYFFQQYGLPQPLTLTYHPEAGVRISAYEKISESQNDKAPKCIFTEAQFPEKILKKMTREQKTIIKVLDPLGNRSQTLKQILEELQNTIFSCYSLKTDK